MAEADGTTECCHLCGLPRALRESHIIPDWVYRDEIRGPGGKMIDLSRMRANPRAITLRLLCEECEQRFSRNENPAKKFATESQVGAAYGDWLFPFATSISWRVLKYQMTRSADQLSPHVRDALAADYTVEALNAWGTYLRHGILVPGSARHRQHMFMVSPDYVARKAIALTIGSAGGHTFVFSRFSFYVLLGILHSENPRELQSSEIKLHHGRLADANRMPAALAHYLHGLELEVADRTRLFMSGEGGPKTRTRGAPRTDTPS